MHRASVLNEDHCGFHSRSILLDATAARRILGLLPGTKGYSDPILDVEGTMLVLECPVHPFNMRSVAGNHEITGEVFWGGPDLDLIPYRCWQEKWNWEKVASFCDTVRCFRWKFQPEIGEVVVEGNAHKNSQGWYCRAYPNISEGFWDLSFSWSLDPQNVKTNRLQGLVPKALESILNSAGLSEWVSAEDGPFGYCTWEIKPSQGKMPRDMLWLQTAVVDRSFTTYPVNPAVEGTTSVAFSNIHLRHLAYDIIDRIFRDLIKVMSPKSPDIRELKFQPSDTEIPAFREWAEPRFGGPWLQYISGWAIKTPSPEDIDDSLPDWVLLPVAHFKILGSWRIVTVVKEPGGWRFHVTGKYTKDPLKHRHIRDELARKAGMTSDTLWEPQEVGEGWLGVPG